MYLFVFIAAAAACYFAVAAWRQPRPGAIIAAIAWLLYAAYEFLIGYGVLCDANCNIRVDLILIWPVVWIASLFGIYARGQWTSAGKALGGLSLLFLVSMVAVFLYIALVETPAAERAAQAKSCDTQGENGRGCAPVAPSADGTTGAK